MIRNVRLYLRLVLLQLRTAMEYRGDFWIAILGALLQQAVGLVFLITFFSQVSVLGGWTVWNVLVLHGLIMTSIGLTEMFTEGAWRLRIDVNAGTFDRILVRPLPPVMQQLSSAASIHGVGDAALGVAMLITGLIGSEVAWHWWTIPVLIMAGLSGTAICASIHLITNLPVFWEPSAQSAFPVMVSRMRDFAKFPLTIYPGPTTSRRDGHPVRLRQLFSGAAAARTRRPGAVVGIGHPASGSLGRNGGGRTVATCVESVPRGGTLTWHTFRACILTWNQQN